MRTTLDPATGMLHQFREKRRRANRIQLWASDKEKAEWEARAHEAGLTFSEWARTMLSRDPHPEAAVKEEVRRDLDRGFSGLFVNHPQWRGHQTLMKTVRRVVDRVLPPPRTKNEPRDYDLIEEEDGQ